LGRGGGRADERQRVRADRLGLDAEPRGCRADGSGRADRNVVHEPVRLSRSRAGVDGGEGFGAGMHPVADRVRAADAAEVVSPEGGGLSVDALTRNWNYPTKVRFGTGRILELADACRECGITRPLLVTDRGLAATPMV